MARPLRSDAPASVSFSVRLTEEETARLDGMRAGGESRSDVVRRLLGVAPVARGEEPADLGPLEDEPASGPALPPVATFRGRALVSALAAAVQPGDRVALLLELRDAAEEALAEARGGIPKDPVRDRALARLAGMLPAELEQALRSTVVMGEPLSEEEWIHLALRRLRGEDDDRGGGRAAE